MTSPALPPQRSNTPGLLIVGLLAVIFFVLIGALLFLPGRKDRPEAGPPSELFVIPARVRLRTQPSGKAPVLATAGREEKLRLVVDQGAWVKVEMADGKSGWLERSLLEASAEHERRATRIAAIRKLPALDGVAEERTPLHAGPGIYYPVIGEVQSGTRMKVYTRDHDFYAIDIDGEIAYADVDAINVTATEGIPRFEVAASEATPPSSERTEGEPLPGPTEPADDEPPPLIERSEEPVRSGGVYASVPAGGRDPEVLDRVVPEYPRAARAAGAEGSVLIRAIVRKDGTVDDVEVIKDLPYGLGDAARRAVRRWRFRPASFQGEPIDVYYTVSVNFRLAS